MAVLDRALQVAAAFLGVEPGAGWRAAASLGVEPGAGWRVAASLGVEPGAGSRAPGHRCGSRHINFIETYLDFY